jgi:hypothetical protein
LLDLCLCNPLSSLLIGVECNCFYSSVHLHYATNHISLYFFLWCITPDYCCLVDGSVDLGSVVASFFQHFSSHSHVCYLWLIVMSNFFHFCSTLTLLIDVSLFSVDSLGQQTHSLFLCTRRVPPLGSMWACSWSLNKCDSCCCQVFSREIIQLAQRQCLWILLPF